MKSRVNRPFVGIPSFLRAPICDDINQLDSDIAVLGVPTDDGSPFMAGSRFAPRALREHSLRFTDGSSGYYDPETREEYLTHEIRNMRIADVGDVDVLPTNVERTFENITEAVREILQRTAMPVVLGGDHAITYPVVRAFEEPIHVMHFDAHLDYEPFVHDLRFTNTHAFPPYQSDAARVEPHAGGDPQSAQLSHDDGGLTRRRQLRDNHARVWRDWCARRSRTSSARLPLLCQYRRRCARYFVGTGLCVSRTERHGLCRASRHPGRTG